MTVMTPLKRAAQLTITLSAMALASCATHDSSTDQVSDSQPQRTTEVLIPGPVSSSDWYALGQQQADQRQQQPDNQHRAKNLVLVIGDGMGITTLTAGRIFSGQQLGLNGEDFAMSFETLPYSALVKTYNTDLQTPDSAGTITALLTGTKTRAGVLSVGPGVTRGDCASGAGQTLDTLMDLAQAQGKGTGVVSTTRLTHATPAATYAHSVDRNWENDSQLTDEARTSGCQDIATQLVNSDLDIALGGGLAQFNTTATGGARQSGNLTDDWQQRPDHHLLTNRDALQTADLSHGQWLGLFSPSHLPYVDDRDTQTPGLLDMTQAAVQRLSHNEEGYVLVIEAGRIDHAHHEGNGYRALKETEELHQTVDWLLQSVDLENTLLLVTADHSHTLTLAGYPTRGNPMTALVTGNDDHGHPAPEPDRLADGEHYTSMNYRNGPGAVAMPRPAISADEAESPDYRQQALIPMYSETHGGEDVAVYGAGPWSHLLGGTMEQHWLFHLMRHALTVDTATGR